MAKQGCIGEVCLIVVARGTYVGLYGRGGRAHVEGGGFRIKIRDVGGGDAVYVRFIP